jgi:hypothetical protein
MITRISKGLFCRTARIYFHSSTKSSVSDSALRALGPLDGRYEKSVIELQDYFSEYALIKYRVKVEMEWLKFLLDQGMVRCSNNKPIDISSSDLGNINL